MFQFYLLLELVAHAVACSYSVFVISLVLGYNLSGAVLVH